MCLRVPLHPTQPCSLSKLSRLLTSVTVPSHRLQQRCLAETCLRGAASVPQNQPPAGQADARHGSQVTSTAPPSGPIAAPASAPLVSLGGLSDAIARACNPVVLLTAALARCTAGRRLCNRGAAWFTLAGRRLVAVLLHLLYGECDGRSSALSHGSCSSQATLSSSCRGRMQCPISSCRV